MVTRNEGTFDRVLRTVLGIALLAIAIFALANIWQWVLGAVSLILIITGLVGFCPLYRLVGLNTCAVDMNASARR
jgi:uncharacterized membrane protein